MPSVYTFSHTEKELLEELLKVLGTSGGSFREQWSIQAEAVVEPVGWEALWKLSKEFCQKFGVRFPCVAHVFVLGVDWDNLSASVEVRSVQHESVELPSRRDDVPLIELWPTKHQSELCIDAQSTAKFIHVLRFYYNNIWMPWDDLDDRSILPTTLEERMKLLSGISDGSVPTRVARRVTLLRNEAIDTYHKIREAEEMVNPEDLKDDDDSMLPELYMSRCAELHARLDYLLSKWTTFENPLIRSSYIAEQEAKAGNDALISVKILWSGGSIFELQQLCSEVCAAVPAEQRVSVGSSAEEALAAEPALLLVCCPRLLMPNIPLADIVVRGFGGAIISSPEVRSCLVTTTANTELRDLDLRCSQVSTAVVVRHGGLRARGCRLTDDSADCQSDFVQGVVVMCGARLVLEDCVLKNLYTGLVVHSGAHVELRNCRVEGCGVGVQMYEGSRVVMTSVSITGSAEHSVRVELSLAGEEAVHSSSGVKGLEISACCRIGGGGKRDICVVKQESALD